MFAAQGSSQPNVQAGPQQPDITAESVGFSSIAGETKLQLLPSPWPAQDLPKPTSSLLSICSREGLLAAAGPDTLVLGSTKSVRETFTSNASPASNVTSFTPELKISIPKVSQVSFSSDDKYLTVCAADSGGLAVYEVAALKSGKTDVAFQIATEGVPVRALTPNPFAEFGRIHAVVLQDGKLLIADLAERRIQPGKQGPVLYEGVSCVSWSAKGKQVVAGLGNGTAVQLTWDGQTKATIPRPPQVSDGHHVSSIMWLNNDSFFIVYTPTNFDPDRAPDSMYIFMARESGTVNFRSEHLAEPFPPMGMNRSPPHHFIQRLRDFPPNLTDALIFASTTSSEIAVITNSKVPLNKSPEAANSAGTYHYTSMVDDSRRAALPMGDEGDTSAIGVAMDMSSMEPVKKPIRSDETLEESKTPLPLLMALNNDGILSAWWFAYDDSIRQGIAYPGLVAVAGTAVPTSSATPAAILTSSGFGATSSPSRPTFGASQPAFGTSTGLGGNQSAWGSSPQASMPQQSGGLSFGKPAFASSTAFGASTFGQSGGMGAKGSVWGTPTSQAQSSSQNQASTPFGGTSNQAASPFGQLSSKPGSNASPFTAASPFSNLGNNQGGLFGQKTGSAPGITSQQSFGSTVTIGSSMDSSFGRPSGFGTTPSLSKNASDVPFGQPAAPKDSSADDDMMEDDTAQTTKAPDDSQKPTGTAPSGLFGLGPSGFKLGSQFPQNEASKKEDIKKDGNSLFGSGFGASLQNSSKDDKPEKKPPALPESPPEKADAGPKVKVEEDDDVPLPPDPTQAQLKEAAKPPPQMSKPAPTPEPPALPSSPKGKDAESEPSPAGSPPVDLGEEPSSPNSTAATETPQQQRITSAPIGRTPNWSFGGVSQNPSPLSHLSTTSPSQATEATRTFSFTPNTTTPKVSKPPVHFDFPGRAQESPRSPSPVRNDQTSPTLGSPRRIRSPSPRRLSQQKSQQQPAPQSTTTTPTAPPPFRQPSLSHQQPSRTVSTSRLDPVPEASTSPAPKQPPADSYRDTTDFTPDNDDAADRTAAELATDPAPTRTLPPFLAHQDYVSRVQGDSTAAQLERLYRDINSMIDTLGLNARALKGFVSGHSDIPDSSKLGDQQRDWLEKPSAWVLAEIGDLSVVQKDLVSHLDANRVHDVRQKVKDIQETRQNIAKLRAKNSDYAHRITLADENSDHPDAVTARQAPLSAEQTAQLYDVRTAYAKVNRQLSETEDAIAVLRAKLASLATARGEDSNGQSGNVPTVEAITNTIQKMTRMAEEKRTNVDLIEIQINKLGLGRGGSEELGMSRLSLGGSVASGATPSKSRNGQTSFDTPQKRAGTYELEFSDDEDEDAFEDARSRGTGPGTPASALKSSMRSSVGGRGGSTGLEGAMAMVKMEDDDDERAAEMRRRIAGKKRVIGLWRNILERKAAGR
ncbi:MAG: hypothetical protein M1828_004792 [Chrysothrix sp. TS-e1954]|nr:MAG: hypothetical protein M1828_004792 [Chrysothrix sp. TS-e1954]